jgi:hypothetical protein
MLTSGVCAGSDTGTTVDTVSAAIRARLLVFLDRVIITNNYAREALSETVTPNRSLPTNELAICKSGEAKDQSELCKYFLRDDNNLYSHKYSKLHNCV